MLLFITIPLHNANLNLISQIENIKPQSCHEVWFSFYKLAKQGICIDKCSISVLCPAGQFLKSLRWGLPQSPVIASRAVRLCMSSGYFAVTGRNKKSEARLCRNIPVLPCLFSSVLLYFLLPIFRGLPLFFHLLAVEHFHVLSRFQEFLHLLLCFPVVPVRRLFL